MKTTKRRRFPKFLVPAGRDAVEGTKMYTKIGSRNELAERIKSSRVSVQEYLSVMRLLGFAYSCEGEFLPVFTPVFVSDKDATHYCLANCLKDAGLKKITVKYLDWKLVFNVK